MHVRVPLALAVLAAACASPSPPAPPPAAPPTAVIPPAAPATVETTPATAPLPETPQERPRLAAAPPSAALPPQPHTAKDGDGQWRVLPSRGDTPLYVTTLHVHPLQSGVTVTVVAIDLERSTVHLVAGTREPESEAAIPETKRTGLVPAADHAALLAVMNGGWKAHHGHFGMRIGDDVFLPPKEGGCAVALDHGRVVVAPWNDIAAKEKDFEAYRQTPGCLVLGSKPHEDLMKDPMSRKWGATDKGGVEIRRSALGVDASGRYALFGLGENTTARGMADGMVAAGAATAAELDVNWSYTRFFVYGADATGKVVITKALVPKIDVKPNSYVERSSERDFFYVAARP